uniref:Uncharacterized protein n=1 Tax=Oryza glumipatula TaxID=40148 RepID=A0A0D9ZWE8_9ORYZ
MEDAVATSTVAVMEREHLTAEMAFPLTVARAFGQPARGVGGGARGGHRWRRRQFLRHAPRGSGRPAAQVVTAAAAIRDRDTRGGGGERAWDFAQSLSDTYELVAVARKLESGLVLADHHPAPPPRGKEEEG